MREYALTDRAIGNKNDGAGNEKKAVGNEKEASGNEKWARGNEKQASGNEKQDEGNNSEAYCNYYLQLPAVLIFEAGVLISGIIVPALKGAATGRCRHRLGREN